MRVEGGGEVIVGIKDGVGTKRTPFSLSSGVVGMTEVEDGEERAASGGIVWTEVS